MPIFTYPETATLISEAVTGQDADGNDVTTPTETPVTGVYAPAGSVERVSGGGDVVTTTPTFYLSDGEPVPKATDQIRVRGLLYNINGEPHVYVNPFTGDQPGAVLRLERVTG